MPVSVLLIKFLFGPLFDLISLGGDRVVWAACIFAPFAGNGLMGWLGMNVIVFWLWGAIFGGVLMGLGTFFVRK